MTGQAYLMRGWPILLQLLICHFICCTVFISLSALEVTSGPLYNYLYHIRYYLGNCNEIILS